MNSDVSAPMSPSSQSSGSQEIDRAARDSGAMDLDTVPSAALASDRDASAMADGAVQASPSKRRASGKSHAETAAADLERQALKERKQLLDQDFNYQVFVCEEDFDIIKPTQARATAQTSRPLAA